MKKYLILTSLTVLAGFCSCNDEDPPVLNVSEIGIIVPDNGASVDLNSVINVAFAWEKAFIVDRYELVFSKSEDLSDPISLDVSRTPFLVSAAQMNDIAAQFGIITASSGQLYWTVRSARSSQPSISETRAITVKRLPPQPLTPTDNSTVTLDYEAPGSKIGFSWEELPGTETYKLVVSNKADLSDPVMSIEVTELSEDMTHQDFQDLIDNATLGLKRFKTNTLYWNVWTGDKYMSNTHWRLRVNGMRIFTDVRGDESITYKVTVLPYPTGSETVWMAENLRASKLRDGTDLVYDGPDAPTSQYIPAGEALVSAGTQVPEAIRPLAGVYYRINMIGDNSGGLVWPDLLAPEGFKVPTLTDWQEMTDAALIASPMMEVVRSPEAFSSPYIGKTLDDSLMNLWNMNLAGCGVSRDNSPIPYIREFAVLNAQHMMYAFNSVTQSVTVTYNPGNNDRTRAIGLGTTGPICVRLMYTGDDQ